MSSDSQRLRLGALVSLMVILILSLLCAGREKNLPTASAGTELPILMYHHVHKKADSWGKFVISPGELAEDLKYLKENGYQTVSIEDLENFTSRGKALPEKPVMLTFDDGYVSFSEYVLPLLEQYDFCAVLSVVGSYTDLYTACDDRNVAYAYVNWEEVAALHKTGRVDIGNHTHDMHTNGARRGCMKKVGETLADYEQVFRSDVGKNQEQIKHTTGTSPLCFTYPYGFISPESVPILDDMGFSVSLSCNEGINLLTGTPDELFGLKRYNRPHGKSAAAILR